ncbi:hypothetical protein T06_12178 [Trichinella sp. T6]|nr:hypothetical protein T06_12178 [Trichinella sp. T6]
MRRDCLMVLRHLAAAFRSGGFPPLMIKNAPWGAPHWFGTAGTTPVRPWTSFDVDNKSANSLGIAARTDRCLSVDSCSLENIFSMASCAGFRGVSSDCEDSALISATARDFRHHIPTLGLECRRGSA